MMPQTPITSTLDVAPSALVIEHDLQTSPMLCSGEDFATLNMSITSRFVARVIDSPCLIRTRSTRP
jgi:hypothetical protein